MYTAPIAMKLINVSRISYFRQYFLNIHSQSTYNELFLANKFIRKTIYVWQVNSDNIAFEIDGSKSQKNVYGARAVVTSSRTGAEFGKTFKSHLYGKRPLYYAGTRFEYINKLLRATLDLIPRKDAKTIASNARS